MASVSNEASATAVPHALYAAAGQRPIPASVRASAAHRAGVSNAAHATATAVQPGADFDAVFPGDELAPAAQLESDSPFGDDLSMAGAHAPGVSPAWAQTRLELMAAVRAQYEADRAQALAQGRFTHTVRMLEDPDRFDTWVERESLDEAAFAADWHAHEHSSTQALAQHYGVPAEQLPRELLDLALRGAVGLYEGPAPAGRVMAEAAQIAALDAYLNSDIARVLRLAFDAAAAPAPVSALALDQVRQYGQGRYDAMTRLDAALAQVQRDYAQALAQAQADATHQAPGWALQTVEQVSREEFTAGLTLRSLQWRFEQQAFTRDYLNVQALDTPPGRAQISRLAFGALYGEGREVSTTTGGFDGMSDQPGTTLTQYVFSVGQPGADGPRELVLYGERLQEAGLIRLDLDDPPRLHDPRAIHWDPLLGAWVTPAGNRDTGSDWLDAVPAVLMAAVASAFTYGAATSWATGVASSAFGSGAAATAVGALGGGAIAGGAAAMASGLTAGRFSWADILRGMELGALGAGVSLGSAAAGASVAGNLASSGTVSLEAAGMTGRLLADALRVIGSGLAQDLTGGPFQAGAGAALGSVLGEVAGAQIAPDTTDGGAAAITSRTVASLISAGIAQSQGGNGATALLGGLLSSGLTAAVDSLGTLDLYAPQSASQPGAPQAQVRAVDNAIDASHTYVRTIVDRDGAPTGQRQTSVLNEDGTRTVSLSAADGQTVFTQRFDAQVTQFEIDEFIEYCAQRLRGEAGPADSPYLQVSGNTARGPRAPDDPAMRVFTLERLSALPTLQIQGAGSASLAAAMFTLELRRDPQSGDLLPNPDNGAVENALNVIARERGVPIHRIRTDYVAMIDLANRAEQFASLEGRLVQPFVERGDGERRVPMLSSAQNGLVAGVGGPMPDNGSHMASLNQLRFGSLVGESLNGLDPVFGALLSPTGGIPGAGNAMIGHLLYGISASFTERAGTVGAPNAEIVGIHGVAHDAAGYLRTYQGIGPGYNYVPDSLRLLADSNPLAGQISGISFFTGLLRRLDPNYRPIPLAI